jgi:uncharacterized membrane protein YcaP (DUF421 family)
VAVVAGEETQSRWKEARMTAIATAWEAILAFTARWWIDPLFRPVVVYLFLVVALRLAGKRLLAQLNAFDLAVLLILSNTLQNAILGDDTTWTGGLVRASTLLVVNAIVVRVMVRYGRLEDAIEGHEDSLITDGVIQSDVLRRDLITEPELRAAAHKQGFESLAEITKAAIAPGGFVYFERRHETDDQTQHEALLARLDRIERLLGDLNRH